jgi:hypothetical protein
MYVVLLLHKYWKVILLTENFSFEHFPKGEICYRIWHSCNSVDRCTNKIRTRGICEYLQKLSPQSSSALWDRWEWWEGSHPSSPCTKKINMWNFMYSIIHFTRVVDPDWFNPDTAFFLNPDPQNFWIRIQCGSGSTKENFKANFFLSSKNQYKSQKYL